MTKDVLVYEKRNQLFTTSDIIARHTGVRHDKLKLVIKNHMKIIERYGKLSTPLRGESTGGRRAEHYLLNEPQSAFLITLLKNNERVLEFKYNLVKEFYRMREHIREQQSLQWKETRKQGKVQRRLLTDSLLVLEGIFVNDGSKNGNRLYSQYTSMINKAIGIKERDDSNTSQLAQIAFIEDLCAKMILMHIAQGTDRKEIYYICKAQVENITAISRNALLAIGV